MVLSAKPGRCALEVDDFSANVAVWVSIRSTSWNAIVPEVPILPETSTLVFSVTPPVAVVEPATMVGASLVPVMMIVTGLVESSPWLSVTVTP